MERLTAGGICWIRTGQVDPLSLGTEITRGCMAATGEHLTVRMTEEDLTLLLCRIAHTYPEAIKAAARELGDYRCEGPVGTDPGYNERNTRLHAAVSMTETGP